MKYMLDVAEGGKITAWEATSKQVPLAALVGKIKIYSKQPFKYNDRRFHYSLYARQGEMVVVIHCAYLKWKIPLDFNKESKTFYINTENTMQDVYLKDVTLVAYKQAGSTDTRIDISDNNGKIPYLSNIYEYGKICTGGINVDNIPSPQNIVALLEGAPGNADIAWGGSIILTEEGGLAVTNMGNQGRCQADTLTFIEDYVTT